MNGKTPKIFLFAAAGLLAGSCVFAAEWGGVGDRDARRTFAEAGGAFGEGKFSEAAQAYERLLSQGFRSEALWFNAGNAYYRLGQKGRAIHAWEEALKIYSGDEDAAYNLRLVREGLSLKPLTEVSRMDAFFEKWFSNTIQSGLLGALIALLWIAGIGAARIIWFEGCRGYRAGIWIGVTVVALLVCAAFMGFMNSAGTSAYGIVVRPDIEIRHGPSYESAAAFRLSEGQKVRLADRHDGWWYARLSAEESGWAEPDSIERIG